MSRCGGRSTQRSSGLHLIARAYLSPVVLRRPLALGRFKHAYGSTFVLTITSVLRCAHSFRTARTAWFAAAQSAKKRSGKALRVEGETSTSSTGVAAIAFSARRDTRSAPADVGAGAGEA